MILTYCYEGFLAVAVRRWEVIGYPAEGSQGARASWSGKASLIWAKLQPGRILTHETRLSGYLVLELSSTVAPKLRSCFP